MRPGGHGSKPFKQASSTFSIFCDDESSAPQAKVLQRSKATQHLPGLQDKENQVQEQEVKGPRQGLREVRKPVGEVRPRKAVSHEEPPILSTSSPTLDSSMAEGDSPMDTSRVAAMDTSVTCTSAIWRVPPHGETVDLGSCPEYEQDIYAYLRSTEAKYLPKASYMDKQPDITHSMRSILVDWLVEVAEEYKLQTETLYLAVNYIDRFLSTMAVQRSKLQLVGAACMFIAAKYEEIYPPDVGEFVYITDDTYNKRQVLRMEHLVLKVLDFDLAVATSHLFLHKMLEMYKDEDPSEDNRLAALASYLAELVLVEGQDMLEFSASQVAASCVAMARHTLDLEAWPDQLTLKAGYAVSEIRECFVLIHGVFSKASSAAQQAVRDKYKTTKFFSVSELSPPDL